jgi:hypothetical protein
MNAALAFLVFWAGVARADPTPIELAKHVWGPTKIAVDSTHAYFLIVGDGCVARVARGGGKVETLACKLIAPADIAVDEQYVYWVDRGHYLAASSDGAIYRRRKSDGKSQQLVNGLQFPRGCVLDGELLWFVVASDSGGARLLRVAKTGGAPTAVWSGKDTLGLAVAADAIYLTTEGGTLHRIAKVDGADLILSERIMFNIPAVSATSVFALTIDGVQSWPLGGGPPFLVEARSTLPLAVAGDFVYYGRDTQAGEIVRMSVTGGPAQVLAKGQNAGEIAVDGGELLWTNGAGHDGSVRKLRLTVP